MIKNIKDGLSHVRKDKIKIQYEIEFKKLINLSDDLIDQFISIKWERGKNEKGTTRDIRVVDSHIENFHHSTNLTQSVSFSQIPYQNSANHSHSNQGYPLTEKEKNRYSLNMKDNVSGSGSNNSTQTTSTSSNTPYIELEKIPKTLTRKQSKLLLGNKIDGSNNMSSGDGIAIVPQEKVLFKVHLFSNTVHSKNDHILYTNYEQKLLNIFIYHNNNILCHTSIDLSLHTEENTNNSVIVPFPSSSLSQPTLYMNIKSSYLKYNDKPIIKASKDIISKKELNNIIPTNVNKLLEYQGEVYFIKNNNNNNNNKNSVNNLENNKEDNYNNSSKEQPTISNRVLKFDLENIQKHSPPIIVTDVDSNSCRNNIKVNNNNNNNNSTNSSTNNSTNNSANSSTNNTPRKHYSRSNSMDNNNNNNNYENEKNSSQSTMIGNDISTWDELTEEDHFKSSISEIQHNKIVCQKNEEIKELSDKIKKLQNDLSDQKRLSTSLQTLIDDCRVKVLEYEEHYHRSQSLENYAKKQLFIERLEFQKKLEKLTNQIKQLEKEQHDNGKHFQNLSTSVTHILNNNSKDIIKDVILNSNNNLTSDPTLSSTTNTSTSNVSSNESSPKSINSDSNDSLLIEKDDQIKKQIEKIDNLDKELTIKLNEIKLLSKDNSDIQSLFKKQSSEKDQLELVNIELSNKVQELRNNIEKITKSQIQEDLKRENEIRKRKNNFLFPPSDLNNNNGNNSNNTTTKNNNNNNYKDTISKILFKINPIIPWCLFLICLIFYLFKDC